MNITELAPRGEYNTSFFSFFINTVENLIDENGNFNHDLNDKDKGTFIHEYIHYIQNISTTFGLMDISKTYHLFSYVINKINDYQETTLNLPIDLDTNDIVVQNYYHSQIAKCNNPKKYLEKRNRIECQYISKEILTIKQTVLKVTCFSDDEQTDEFIFGATCIKETMAHLVQALIDPESAQNHEDIPYKSAEIIVQNIYPELIEHDEDKLNIIVLCYFSLGVLDCGRMFYEVLLELKKRKYVSNNPIEFSEYLNSEIAPLIKIKPIEDDRVLWDVHWEEALKALKSFSILKDIPDWQVALNYLEQIFNSVKNIQNEYPEFFICFITLLKTEHRNNAIDKLLGTYGMPHVYTEYYDFFANLGGGLIYLSTTIPILYNLLKPDYKGCNPYLQMRCRNKQIESDDCVKNPWNRIKNDSPECPFTIMWKNLGLDKKDIIKS